MGSRGPVPKRETQRRRRNKTDGPPPTSGRGSGTAQWVAYAQALGVEVPEGASRRQVQQLIAQRDEGWHPLAREWFESLSRSGQSAFYEPSDWATARVLTEVLSKALTILRYGGRGAGTLLERWQAGTTDLLTTEGARRRVRLELEVEKEDDQGEAAEVTDIRSWRESLGVG